jgi:hypothetical protein
MPLDFTSILNLHAFEAAIHQAASRCLVIELLRWAL